jgi:hypothetical protein
MNGLHIYISPDKLSVTNERVHISFDRHFLDEPGDNTGVSSDVRVLRGTDIPRLFDAINALNGLSILPPGNEHRGNPSGENTVAADLAALEKDDEEEKENGRRRPLARNR